MRVGGLNVHMWDHGEFDTTVQGRLCRENVPSLGAKWNMVDSGTRSMRYRVQVLGECTVGLGRAYSGNSDLRWEIKGTGRQGTK